MGKKMFQKVKKSIFI